MEEQFTSEQLQPIEQARKEDYAQKKKSGSKKEQKRLKALKIKDLKKGDILHTREYIVQLNRAEKGENGSYRLHCNWGHCTADGSKDYFMNDWIECLPEHIVKLWPRTKGGV